MDVNLLSKKVKELKELSLLRLYGTMQIDEKGILNIGGVKTTELAEEYGSPLIVIDEKEIENNGPLTKIMPNA